MFGRESITTIPVLHFGGYDQPRSIGEVAITEDQAVFRYKESGSWETFATQPLENTPIIREEDDGDVAFFVENDAPPVSKIWVEYCNMIEEMVGDPVLGTQEIDTRTLTPDECGCSKLTGQIAIESTESIPGITFFSCEDCGHIYGVYKAGKRIYTDVVLSADWVFGGQSPPVPMEIDSDSDYLIRTDGTTDDRSSTATAVLSETGARAEGGVVSRYEPEEQDALLYVADSEIAGYLSWEVIQGNWLLSQLFVLEEYRGHGIASTLVSTWYTDICDVDTYYVDDPASEGRSVIESVGHFNISNPRAFEAASLTPAIVAPEDVVTGSLI